MRSRRPSFALRLPARVFLGAVAMLLVVLAVAFVLLSRWSRRTAEESMRKGLEQSVDLVAQFLAGRQRSLTGGARVFVQAPYFRAIVAERRRDDILDQSFEAAAQLDADWVFVVDERGILLAKSDEPGASGGDLGGVPLVRGALRGRVTSGFGVSRDSLLFHAVAVPIAVPGGAPIGALVATKIVDAALARDVRAVTASEVVFFVRDTSDAPRVAASTLARPLADRLMAMGEARAGDAGAGRDATSRAELGGATYALQRGRLTTAGGEPVGGFVVLREASGVDGGAAAVRRALLAAGLVGLALALAAAMVASRRVAAPLAALAASVRRMREGELAEGELSPTWAGVDADHHRRDEIGELGAALSALSGELRDRHALASLSSAAATPAAPEGHAPAPRTVGRVLGTARRGGAAAEQSVHPVSAIAPAHQMEPGTALAGRYVIEAVIGRGAFATVYRAVDRACHEVCAVKVLAAPAPDLGPAALAQMRPALSRLRGMAHRNIVRLRDVGAADDRLFLALEYVEGETLAALLRARGALPHDAVLSIAKQLCRAMRAAQDAGVAHGALSPSQLLVRGDGVLKVSDYGMTLAPGAGASTRPPRIAGATVGAPEYMAPEQLLGAPPDAAVDLYAAGVVLSECMVGTTPFRSESPLAFLAHKLGGSPPAGGEPGSALQEIIGRMAEPERERRLTSPAELLQLLERLG